VPGRTSGVTPRRGRPDGGWLSVSAAAKALGVSASTLRLWASEGRVPHVRTAGGHRRFNPEALRQWLAEQPGPGMRGPRRGSARLQADPTLARELRGRAERVAVAVGGLVDGPAQAAYRRLSPEERREVVRDWVEVLADAFETGTLSDALERAETYGHAHGLAGSSAEVTLGGSLALERAIARALVPPEGIDPVQAGQVLAAVDRLTITIASAWASALAGRGTRPAGRLD
jgi:excisionase family DNA binding protein